MTTRRTFLAISGALALGVLSMRGAPSRQAGSFLVLPYVQIGPSPGLLRWEKLDILWHTADTDARWAVEYRVEVAGEWRRAPASQFHRVAMPGVEPHRVYRAVLRGLRPGARVSYRVLLAGRPVFESETHARPARSAPCRVILVGDCADGSQAPPRVACRMASEKPKLIVIAGDIVYGQGTIGQYRERYFPVYNADSADEEHGAPLARSVPIVGVVGNHDVGGAALDRYPGGLAYYLYFSQPLNGPRLSPRGTGATPVRGSDDAVEAFRAAAGVSFPTMASFSFDYGNAHWTCLDANTYADWDQPAMRSWLEADLSSAPRGAWRFVVFHQPGFSSSRSHFSEQYMRRLAPIFERHGVDVVWTGHVHNYQRSLPLRFAPASGSKGYGPVAGKLTLDRHFDGATVTRANGVVYIVTGGGGARLYNPEQQDDPSSWQPFTARFVADAHSFSVLDIAGRKLTVRQVDEHGKERDRFTLTR